MEEWKAGKDGIHHPRFHPSNLPILQERKEFCVSPIEEKMGVNETIKIVLHQV